MTTKHFLITTIILSTCLTACQATPKKSAVEGKEPVSLSILSPSTPSEPIPIPPASSVPALYAILIADTRDHNIGDSTLADLNNLKILVENISKHTQLPSYPLIIQGDQLSRQTVVNTLTQLSLTSQDRVIFYYSGHGTRGLVSEQRDSKWPYLCVNGGERCSEKENRLDLDEVVTILKEKGPRFLIVMADACNDLIRSRRSKPGPGLIIDKPDNYRKLFLEPSDFYIIASGSKAGQVSVGDETGGRFTNQFLKVLYAELAADDSPNWETIMQRAVDPISYPYGIGINEIEMKIQQPQFEFLFHAPTPPLPPTPGPIPPDLEPPKPIPPIPVPTPVNSEEIHLEILPSTRLSPSEAAQLAVTATQGGYLFIFDAEHNNGGTLSQVFPNSAYQERSGRQYFQLQANTKFLLPDERYFELAANIRAPQEIGSRSLVALLITADQDLEKVQQLSNQPISAITDWLTQNLQNNQWVMTTTTYEITQY